MKARLKLSPQLLDIDRQASQLCARYQIRKTHDGVMLWKLTDQWRWLRPYPNRDEAEEYLVGKLAPPSPTTHQP